MRKKNLIERFGKLPPDISKADAHVILEFLYSAFDKRMARQVEIFHPYSEEEVVLRLTIADFCRWLKEQI